jgi:hypothetical protein
MTSELQLLVGITLLFLLGVMCIANKPKTEPIKEEKIVHKPQTKTKHRRDEVIDTLDWMLVNHIITTTEYNKMMVKCLPFIE